MCGISGIIGAGAPRGAVEAMVAVQHHRGPDDSGVEILAKGNVALGHNRLNIIDLTPAGRQPMFDRTGDLAIVFNGEIYNYLEIRAALKGYPFRSETDTEVILAAYERWGEGCLDRFIGMFAFAIWDSRKQSLFCARDRLGVKPFHYARHNERFLFASEIKALLVAGVPAEPDMESWSLYLGRGVYERPERTFFRNINALPAAHAMVVGKDGVKRQWKYWDLPEQAEALSEKDDDAAADELRGLLEDSVRLRMRADVPIGVMLSGGLDSSSVMTTVDRLLPEGGEIQTFTGVFGDKRYDEDDFSEQVPRKASWERNIATFKVEDFWSLAETAQWHQEAPFGGVSTLLYHPLHELAREKGVKVLLEGQGGDELFAGYGYFKPHYYCDVIDQGGWRALRREIKSSPQDEKKWLAAAKNIESGRAELVHADGSSHLRPECLQPELALREQADVFPAPFSDKLRNALFRDLCITKLPRVLRMNDRVSMAYGLELRQPLIDHRLVEYAFRLPGNKKIREGNGKFILRHAMRHDLPNKIRNSAKRFVVTPQKEWLSGPLASAVQDIIESRSFRERGIFDVDKVRQSWQHFCSEGSENSFFVWQWINTELWFRQFIDRKADILSVA